MTYRQFLRWCSKRAHDGCWGYAEAIVCLTVIEHFRIIPFWRRKAEWEKYESDVLEIVNRTNEKIREYLGTEVEG